MFRTGRNCIWIAAVVAAGLAIAPVAHAGGYAGNKCVSKKQKEAGKYAKKVGKAWTKHPSDTAARDADILKAFGKLDTKWTKEEAKAVKKNASCDESTATATAVAALVDATFLALSGENQDAAARYVFGAMKAWSKNIKDPVKDPGKAKLTQSLADANTKYLVSENATVNTAATTLEGDLVEATTTAPDYPTTFQQITPGATVEYGKKTLNPTCVDGDPYSFWARKGTSNNVLMYYQGGGACWDSTSCFGVPGGTCKRTAGSFDDPGAVDLGFADYDNPSNPFSDWSVVFVTYCSCDVHWGENIEVYAPGQIGRHMGRVNAAVAEKFAREHFIDPDKVFVTGSSAGSYGAIMNSYWLMKEVWPNADFSVLGDAGIGVITQRFLTPSPTIDNIQSWGVDNNFPDDLPGVVLPVENLSLVDLVDGLAQTYPNHRFGNYDASYDGGGGSQCQFFQTMRVPSPPGSFLDWGNWWEAACDWNACMREFKAENASRASNYHFYTGAGTRHTVFGSDKIYTETKNTKADGTPVTVVDWVAAMIDDTADFVDIDCNHPGGDCDLTNSCQGGVNAGDPCSVDGDCNSGGCQGGANDGLACTSNGDCPDGFCPFCQHDPDSANPPLNNDGTVTCPATTCPCGLANAECIGGANDGLVCTTDGDCPSGTCVWVRCPD